MIKSVLSKYGLIILAVVIALVLGYIGYLKISLANTEKELVKVQSKLATCKLNKANLETQVKVSNQKIEEYSIDLKLKQEEYMKLLEQEPEVRFKYIYKDLPTIGKESDECKDIKKLLDDIRSNSPI